MDVIFETSRGRHFTIEIGFFDTVLEIKEKIKRHEGYPVSSQKLVFKGEELIDDRDTEHYEILQGSRLQLIVAEPDDGSRVSAEEAGRVHVIVKIPISKRQLSLGVSVMDVVSSLKERIQESEGIPVNRFALFYGTIELQDNRALADYGVTEHSEVNVVTRPFLPAPTTSASKKLKLMVLPKCGTKKIPVEVNASDNVSELRKELQRLHAHLQFDLPSEGYFFIYKQNVMDDDQTFRWHDIRPGDTIEIFNGNVTGGS
ncbi:polyubiquitin-like [Phoenix dactylifera]|uniref:Polyubiquitin-like n=1 Tax=Phoenix dactylifera TaxID=42345 RepID=A0A8B7BK47_PHODC|nr:polyubiquitin-like [Phoenix dactylifera]